MLPYTPDLAEQAMLRRAVERGYLTHPQVQQVLLWVEQALASARAPAPPGALLRTLETRRLLAPQQLAEMRRVELQARQTGGTPASGMPRPVAPTAATLSGVPAAGGLTPLAAATWAQVEAAYTHACRYDPRFAPHARVVLEQGEELGRGGMGVVHRVLDRRLGREAALKVLLGDPPSPEWVRRFRREAEITARLVHPAIPPVYESGTDAAGRHYLLMKVIEGQALSKRIAAWHESGRPAQELPPLLEALVKVGEAVAYAHSRRIVHRDLKPANVMLGQFGEVLVLDWGLARLLDSDEEDADELLRAGQPTLAPPGEEAGEGLTQAGAVLGTPGYMPPEQAGGNQIDERVDVFALGAILTEILTGKPPIEGNSAMNKVFATMQGKVVLPRERDSRVSPELNAMAAAALAVDPRDRTASAEEFVADLRRYLAGEQVSVHRYGLRERILRAARRRPALLVGVSAAALLLGLGGLLAMQLARTEADRAREAQLRQEAEAQTREAERGREQAEALQQATEHTQRAMDLLNEAQDQAQRGAPDEEVVRRVKEALGEAPARFLLWNAARVYEEAGLWEEAQGVLERSVHAYPPGYRELYYLHRVEILSSAQPGFQRWTQPLERMAKLAAARGDENEYTYYLRGYGIYQRGDPQAAIPWLEQALELSPRLAWAWTVLADCRGDSGDHQGALLAYEHALKLDPRLTGAWVNRAGTRVTLGHLRGAIEDCTRALEIAPRLAPAYVNRAVAYGLLNEPEQARADCDRALELNPDYVTALYNRGVARLQLGDAEGALADCQRAVRLDPNNTEALYNLGVVHRSRGDEQAALHDFDRVLEIDPTHGIALAARGALRLGMGDLRGAFEDSDRAVKLVPHLSQAWANRGLARAGLPEADLRESVRDLERFLSMDPENPGAPVIRSRLKALEAALAGGGR